jgi:hypothetical protein
VPFIAHHAGAKSEIARLAELPDPCMPGRI